MKPHPIKEIDVHGQRQTYYIVWWNNAEYMFGTYIEALRFAISHSLI